MNKVELLYDHYKETFSIIQNNLKQRNRFFVIMFLTMALQLLLALSPNSIFSLINFLVLSQFDVDISGYMLIIQSLLWLLLLYLTMRYYQTSVYIERCYNYIHSLEQNIEQKTKIKFDREGGDYLSDYPKMCDFIDVLYKWVFPIIYCFIISFKIMSELNFVQCEFFSVLSFVIDIIFFSSCLILTTLYLVFLHCKRSNK